MVLTHPVRQTIRMNSGKVFRAQAVRMNRLIDQALGKLRAIEGGKYYYNDDDAFMIHQTEGARLAEMDLTIHSGTLKPQKLLKNDGTIVTEVIKSVRAPNPGNTKRAKSFQEGSKLLTVKSFLGTRAIRAKHSMDDIDYCSNNNSTPCHLQKITVPILILGMGGHYFLRDNEIHYEVSASSDKEYIVIEGASTESAPLLRKFSWSVFQHRKIPSITLRSDQRALDGNEAAMAK
jgi:hypothetical protein